MGEAPTRNMIVFFAIVLLTLMNFRIGKASDLLESPISESNLTSKDVAEYFRRNVNGKSSAGFNFHGTTELFKVNDTTEWSSRNETVPEKISHMSKKAKGYFGNLTDSFLGGGRKKRSTTVPGKLYIGRNAKLWRSLLEDLHGYGRNGGVGFERQYRDTHIRRPVSYKWYNWERVGNEEVTLEKNGFLPKKDLRYVTPNYETYPSQPHPPPSPVKSSVYETSSQSPKLSLRTRNRHLPGVQQTYDPTMYSVKIFKHMRNKLMMKGKKEKVGEQELRQHEVPETMQVYTGSQGHPSPQSQYKCKAGTNGLMSYQEGRTMSSRGITYSEEDNRGIRTLLCKAETSDVSEPDQDIFLKNSIVGLNVVTNDRDPFKLLERGNEIDIEALEIGSQSGSELTHSSVKNQSMSSVSTQGRGAHSQTKVNTKFVYENGYRTAFESRADVEGSTRFNSTDGQVPLVLKSRKEESSSIMQNPDRLGEESAENESVATFMNYNKKVDFDIAFRNLFDY